MPDLTPKQIDQYKKVEELLDFKRDLLEEKKTVAAALSERVNLIREKADDHGIDLSDLDARILQLQEEYDKLSQQAAECFREACSTASQS